MADRPPEFRTTLYDWHLAQGGKMMPFAGFSLPVQYPDGIIAEHLHARSAAALFDVSHMGQMVLRGRESWKKFARLVPGDVPGLKPWQMRYSCLLNEWGGVVDDIMIVRPDAGDDLWLIVNAARRAADTALIGTVVPPEQVEMAARDLVALQGPKAARVLVAYTEAARALSFMQATWTEIHGIPALLMRSGYTGEDGFEISVEPRHTLELTGVLMRHPDVKPAGLGARDTLRLEAGLCLYGHELDEKITPVEAGLSWLISRPRLARGEFAGASIIEAQILNPPERLRVGLVVDGRAPAREGCEIQEPGKNRPVGVVTSGTFSPTLNHPIAMGYVEPAFADPDQPLNLMVRGRPVPARVTPLPFVSHRYEKQKKQN